MLFKQHEIFKKCDEEVQLRLWNENDRKCDGVLICPMRGNGVISMSTVFNFPIAICLIILFVNKLYQLI